MNNIEERLAFVESMTAKTHARQMANTITLASFLSGELTLEILLRLKEGQIAAALQTKAPDQYIDELEDVFGKFARALEAGSKKRRPTQP